LGGKLGKGSRHEEGRNITEIEGWRNGEKKVKYWKEVKNSERIGGGGGGVCLNIKKFFFVLKTKQND
jgi:hypothetical protein